MYFLVPTRSGIVCDKELTFDDAAIFAYTVDNQYWYQMFIGKKKNSKKYMPE